MYHAHTYIINSTLYLNVFSFAALAYLYPATILWRACVGVASSSSQGTRSSDTIARREAHLSQWLEGGGLRDVAQWGLLKFKVWINFYRSAWSCIIQTKFFFIIHAKHNFGGSWFQWRGLLTTKYTCTHFGCSTALNILLARCIDHAYAAGHRAV